MRVAENACFCYENIAFITRVSLSKLVAFMVFRVRPSRSPAVPVPVRA